MDNSEQPNNKETAPVQQAQVNNLQTEPSDSNAPQTPGAAPNQGQSSTSSPNATSKKSRKWLWFILIIVLLVVLGAVYFIYHRDQNKSGKHDIPLIKFGIVWSPLNVFYPSASSAATEEWQNQIFEGLVKFDNGLEIKPQIASSWSNPDATTWIFNLKPDIHFHDGNTVTAQDVVYSWQQVMNESAYSYLTGTIKDVTALNDNTVKITTNQPDVLLLNRLTQMYILDSKAPKDTQPWGLGTGAYTVKPGTKPSGNNMDLVAYDNWHGGHAYTRAIDYSYVSSTTQAINGIKSGQYNLVDSVGFQDQSTIDNLSKNYTLFSTPQLAVNSIAFSTANTKSPVSNILIRKAFALAIDNNTIVQEGQQTGTPIDQTIPSNVPGYNPAIKPIQRNVSEAAALVKQAGYPNGVTIQLYSTPNVSALNQAIVDQAKPAGINVVVNTNTSQTQLSNILSTGSFDTVTALNFTQIIDGSDILSGFNSVFPFDPSPQLTTELNNANTATTPEQHLKYLQDASLTLYNDYAYIPLYQATNLNVSDKNYVLPLNVYDSDLNTYFANVYSTK